MKSRSPGILFIWIIIGIFITGCDLDQKNESALYNQFDTQSDTQPDNQIDDQADSQSDNQTNSQIVGYWKFNEVDGTSAVDSSGMGNHATVYGGASWTTAGIGGALKFDGIDDSVHVPDTGDINLGLHRERSLAVWFYVNDKQISSRKQVIYEEGGISRGLNIYVYDNKLYVGGWNKPELEWSGTYLSSAQIESGKWHHVTLVLSGGNPIYPDTFKLFIDGNWIGNGDGGDLYEHNDDIGIGAVRHGTIFHDGSHQSKESSHWFAGLIDEMRIYNKALLPDEIAHLASEVPNDPPTPDPPTPGSLLKLLPPPDNRIYHAAYPDFGGWEDEVTAEKVNDFETLTGKNIIWAYLSNNWWQPNPGIHFPADAVNEVYNRAGRIPFIRMMPRNEDPTSGNIMLPDPKYSMQAFIDGNYDTELTQWALAAKGTKIPLLVEFGTECNGWWFPWNAMYNGKDTKTEYGDPNLFDGMERFRDAYRHIIDLFNSLQVDNITWFFHVDVYNDPDSAWNQMAGYYPGDEYIDWIGISVYGPQERGEGWWLFSDALNDSWEEITAISPVGKPIAILEWGVIDYTVVGPKNEWITDAFNAITPGGKYYPEIKAISYWHENFDQTNLRLDSSPEALDAYRIGLTNASLITTPYFSE